MGNKLKVFCVGVGLLYSALSSMQAQSDAAPRMVFFDLQMERTTDPLAPQIQITSQHVADGLIKRLPQVPEQQDGLVISLLNEFDEPLSTQFHVDPLDHWMEAANEDGEIEQYRIELDAAGFFVRFPLLAEATFVQVLLVSRDRTVQILKQPLLP